MAKEPVVYDLDILRPPAQYVRLAGKKIDISFIPSGIAIDIMELRQDLEELVGTPEKVEKIKEGGQEALDSFHLSAVICAKITETQHKEMTKEWLLANTNIAQLKLLIEHITNAVFKSLEGVEPKKKQTAVKKKAQ